MQIYSFVKSVMMYMVHKYAVSVSRTLPYLPNRGTQEDGVAGFFCTKKGRGLGVQGPASLGKTPKDSSGLPTSAAARGQRLFEATWYQYVALTDKKGDMKNLFSETGDILSPKI